MEPSFDDTSLDNSRLIARRMEHNPSGASAALQPHSSPTGPKIVGNINGATQREIAELIDDPNSLERQARERGEEELRKNLELQRKNRERENRVRENRVLAEKNLELENARNRQDLPNAPRVDTAQQLRQRKVNDIETSKSYSIPDNYRDEFSSMLSQIPLMDKGEGAYDYTKMENLYNRQENQHNEFIKEMADARKRHSGLGAQTQQQKQKEFDIELRDLTEKINVQQQQFKAVDNAIKATKAYKEATSEQKLDPKQMRSLYNQAAQARHDVRVAMKLQRGEEKKKKRR